MSESLNRAFMYGESVFTTLRVLDGRLIDWTLHFERIRRGVEFVYGPFTDGDDWVAILKNRLEAKCQNEKGHKVIRLSVYREQARGILRGGLISVTDLRIHSSSTDFDKQRFIGQKLKLRTCPVREKPNWWPAYLKAGNYLDTILAQKVYLKAQDDDVLFISSQEEVLESSVANIFIVKNNKLFTAPIGPNVLDGVMRRKVIDLAWDYFDDFLESSTSFEQLLKADAVFGSNSVRGLFLVDRIDEYELTYNQDFLNKFEKLRDKVFE